MKSHFLAAVVAAAVIAGCASAPEPGSLIEARNEYSAAQSNPQVVSLAPAELKQASEALDRANNAASKGAARAEVEHLAYVARQQVAIARETAAQKAAEIAVANANVERDRVRLEARTREADAARRSAEEALRQSEAARRESEASLRNAEAARREAEASRMRSEVAARNAEEAQRQAAAERQAALDAQAAAQAARQQGLEAEARAKQLEAQLKDLEAKKTDRGMVITLGDVLFDTNQAQLKPGGMRNVQRLAEFLKQYPQRKVAIEGFTDSTGSAARNQELSEQRAQAVANALMGMGIGSERIAARGYGPAYPVAGNDSAGGRQLNRRVEIVVSDDNGSVAPRRAS
jgi:outer membrane protein OmpA-like peptidoglycan-associated protein